MRSEDDLYAIMGLEKSCNQDDIRIAYLRLAKRLHPDKNDSKTAAEEFRRVHAAYVTLIDPKRRKEYDETGRVGIEVVDVPSYATFSSEDLAAFTKSYKGSKEERDDVLKAWRRFKDVDLIIKYVPSATARDKARFLRILEKEK